MNNKYLRKLTKDINDVPWDYDIGYNGLGGWMILFIIGRFLSIHISWTSIFSASSMLGILPFVDALLTVTFLFIPVEIIVNVIILVLLFKKDILFRKVYVIYAAASLLAALPIIIYTNIYFDVFSYQFVGNAIGIAVWTAYLYRSKRVKNTFIYPYLNFDRDGKNNAIISEDV